MSVERREQRPGGMQQGGPMGRGGWGAMGMPVQKAKDFKGTAMRLLGYFLPQKYRLLIVLVTAIIGTVFNIVGPKILGLATTKLFEGIVAKFQHVPGATVDFGYIAMVLLILLGIISFGKGIFKLETGGDQCDADLVFQSIIIAQTKNNIRVFAGLADQVVLYDIHFVHSELVLAFGGVDIDQNPFGSADFVVVQQW